MLSAAAKGSVMWKVTTVFLTAASETSLLRLRAIIPIGETILPHLAIVGFDADIDTQTMRPIFILSMDQVAAAFGTIETKVRRADDR